LHGAIGEPKPVQRPGPPILIGAAGERPSLRVAAQPPPPGGAPAAPAAEWLAAEIVEPVIAQAA
jgi:hypothetical protein